MDSGQVEKDEERKWLKSEEVDSIDREKREDLMSLTIIMRTSVLNSIYYEIRWFGEVILDSKNKRMMQLFLTRIIWRLFTLEVKS